MLYDDAELQDPIIAEAEAQLNDSYLFIGCNLGRSGDPNSYSVYGTLSTAYFGRALSP